MRVRTWGRWGIGIAILIALVLSFDPAAIGALLATANAPLVMVGVAGLTALHLLGAATWRVLTRRLAGIELGWWAAARTYYAAQGLGGLTPANVGSDAYRVAALRDAGESVRGATLPILVQRATSYLAVSLLGAFALLLASRPAAFTVGIVIGALALSTAVLGIASLVIAGPGPLRPLRARLLGPNDNQRPGMTGAIGIGLGLGLVFHAVAIGLTYLLVLAVEPDAATVAALAAVAVARVSLLVPLTPSGLGIQEAALAALFVGIGLPAESAIAASLVARLSLVLTALIGAGAMVLPTRRTASTTGRPSNPVPAAQPATRTPGS